MLHRGKRKIEKKAAVPALLLLGLLFLTVVLRSADAGTPGLQNPDQEGNTAAGKVRLTALSAEDRGNKRGAQGTYGSGAETEADPNDPNVMLLRAMLKQKIAEYTEAVMCCGTDCTEETAAPTAIPAEKGKASKIS